VSTKFQSFGVVVRDEDGLIFIEQASEFGTDESSIIVITPEQADLFISWIIRTQQAIEGK